MPATQPDAGLPSTRVTAEKWAQIPGDVTGTSGEFYFGASGDDSNSIDIANSAVKTLQLSKEAGFSESRSSSCLPLLRRRRQARVLIAARAHLSCRSDPGLQNLRPYRGNVYAHDVDHRLFCSSSYPPKIRFTSQCLVFSTGAKITACCCTAVLMLRCNRNLRHSSHNRAHHVSVVRSVEM